MTGIAVDISDCRVTRARDAVLITYSLGSCIGVTVWDPEVRVGGMLHYMLPDSRLAPEKARENPAMFADTGIPLLFRKAYALGAVKERMIVKAAGGARLFDTTEPFDIGKQNCEALRGILGDNGVRIDAEHVGDTISRTMRLEVATGQVTVENCRLARLVL